MLSSNQFASLVLPSLKPLFAVKDPPQNMLTLLDNLQLLQDKTEKSVFRERMLVSAYLKPFRVILNALCQTFCRSYTTLWIPSIIM